MTRQDSNSELAGNLGASLTPRVDHVPLPLRGVQSSGLFDVGALYAEALDQVMARAAAQTRLLPLARAAQVTLPRAAPWPAHELSVDFDVPIDFARAYAPRSLGLGWFGVAIAWLATVTTAALVAIGGLVGAAGIRNPPKGVREVRAVDCAGGQIVGSPRTT